MNHRFSTAEKVLAAIGVVWLVAQIVRWAS